MGIDENEPRQQRVDTATPSRLLSISVLMTMMAFLAPMASSGFYSGWGFYLIIIAPIWTLNVEGGLWIHFQLFPPYLMITMLPFLLFRFGSVYLIVRYYQGKTTKGRAKIAAFLGDAPFLILYGFAMILSGVSIWGALNFPLPFMMFVSLLLLWRLPRPEATVPWEGMADPTPWWEEEKPEQTRESSNDDQPW